MITAFVGTGGSGKSLDMAHLIYNRIRDKRNLSHANVIANFEMNRDLLYDKTNGRHGHFYYFDNAHLTVDLLKQYAIRQHKPPEHFKSKRYFEGQTLLCIDECQRFFNPREFARRDRMPWVTFFAEHRHWGFDVILTTPQIGMIDKQIVGAIEMIDRHRLMNNKGFIGMLLPFRLFAVSERWAGMPGKAGSLGARYYTYKAKYDGLYDSYKHFIAPKEGKQKR